MKTLARIRVRETHGIRRFLYPLEGLFLIYEEVDFSNIALVIEGSGEPCPMEIIQSSVKSEMVGPELLPEGCVDILTIAFAVSLAPFEDLELHLVLPAKPMVVADPLHLSLENGTLVSRQKRLVTTVNGEACVVSVVYDGIEHLRAPLSITLNGNPMSHVDSSGFDVIPAGPDHIVAKASVFGDILPGCVFADTATELTACKSWINVKHSSGNKAGDEIAFVLPLTVAAGNLICDFGAGGGIYGKLRAGTQEKLVWRLEFADGGSKADWSLSNGDRIDYRGTTSKGENWEQLWFHILDGQKALACAITQLPLQSEGLLLEITISGTGDVSIRIRLGSQLEVFSDIGVCYHFLNDVPAISAATNPQSILLPPIVEGIWPE